MVSSERTICENNEVIAEPTRNISLASISFLWPRKRSPSYVHIVKQVAATLQEAADATAIKTKGLWYRYGLLWIGKSSYGSRSINAHVLYVHIVKHIAATRGEAADEKSMAIKTSDVLDCSSRVTEKISLAVKIPIVPPKNCAYTTATRECVIPAAAVKTAIGGGHVV